MKKLALALLSASMMLACNLAFAENPATSTSQMSAEKEQLKNPGHIIDDCRAADGSTKSGCMTQKEMRKDHKSNVKMLEKGGTTDDVMQKDTQKTN